MVQPFVEVRTGTLNNMLEGAFRRCYPGFRRAKSDVEIASMT